MSGQPYSAEVIVADDGSSDNTADTAASHASHTVDFRLLRLPHRGKAATVRDGILAARGSIILFTDADLPTPMSFSEELIRAIQSGSGVAIGSREGASAQRYGEPRYRHLMGRAFNLVVGLLVVPGIDDTQCGFKAFSRQASRDIFSRALLYADGNIVDGPRVTAFDVEVLYLARKLGYRISEVPVGWSYVPGSKVSPVRDSVRMLGDVLQVRLNAIRGRYD